LNARLEGMDKKLVADSVYNLLPPLIKVWGFTVPIAWVKTLVTQEKFEQWVHDRYEQVHAFILANEAYLASQIKLLTGDEPLPDESAGGAAS
jgi:hypothetical protein